MKLVWSPDEASKAYIDTVKCLETSAESGVAEFLSATAAGWNAELIVETWTKGGPTATSIGLAIARQHTCGRHVCVVPDHESRSAYEEAMEHAGLSPEVVVGEAEEAVGALSGIDFLVVDCRRRDFAQAILAANLGKYGGVLVCKNASSRSSPFRWHSVLESRRIARSVYLPVGRGLDIAHVAARQTIPTSEEKPDGRWIKHVDQKSGDVHMIRI